IGENGTASESTATFDNVSVIAKKLMVFIRASSELADDSDPALGAWFVEEVARALAQKEDEAGFSGDGTSTYAGIRGLAKILIDNSHNAGKVTATGHASYGAIDTTD